MEQIRETFLLLHRTVKDARKSTMDQWEMIPDAA